MRLLSGKRIGQSNLELAYAALLSFILHGVVFAAVFLYVSATPKKYIPPVYQVRLVGQPQDISQAPSGGPAGGGGGVGSALPVPKHEAPPVPKHEERPAQKKSAAPQKVARAAPKTGAMPELKQQKKRPIKEEEPRPEEMVKEQSHASAGATGGSAVARGGQPGSGGPGGAASGVVVGTPQQQGFYTRFQYYVESVRAQIGRNWRPPPDAKDAKARVIFTVNRSGWIAEVRLDEQNSNATFGFKQAAVRAIRSSNPFPSLPEEFAKQTLEFSVDLMEKE